MARRRTITRVRRAALVLPLLFILPGCESPIPRVDPESPPFQGLPAKEVAELQLGRSTYIAKCSGCHALFRPGRGDGGYWTRWVGEMAERSRIAPEERERILDYLLRVCLPSPGHARGR